MSAVEALLDQQEHELEQLAQLLSEEYDALQQRQHDALLTIAQQKSASLQRLSAHDAQLTTLSAELSEEHKLRIAELKKRVPPLDEQNEKNGKLLALTSASHHRLRNLILPPEKVAGTTYTKLGQKHHGAHGTRHFAV